MRVFLAGATGVIGRALLSKLVEAGHTVTAMTRRADRAPALTAAGATPVVADVFDAGRLVEVLGEAAPEVLVHQLTSLPRAIEPRKIASQLAANDRIRSEGTRVLMGAAARSGVRRVVAQSIAFAYVPAGSRVKTEDDPLWLDGFSPWRRSVEAVRDLEQQVTGVDGIEGVVLRYGALYGPDTAYGSGGSVAAAVLKRQFPIVGPGSGVFSFLHVGDAAAAASLAVSHGMPGIYNIVDDEPAEVREWLPVYAHALGAPGPGRVPAILARLVIGRFGLYLMTEQRGASNAKAREALRWSPAWSSWRTGFPAGLRED
jgi:nucleoside-diphosphate-sugar epimerase